MRFLKTRTNGVSEMVDNRAELRKKALEARNLDRSQAETIEKKIATGELKITPVTQKSSTSRLWTRRI
jgi:hypothetical protein